MMLPSNGFSLKYKSSVIRLSVIRSTFKTGLLFNVIHMFHLSGLKSAIKIIYLIILAAVRKGYKQSITCRILTCYSLLAGKTSLCLQT